MPCSGLKSLVAAAEHVVSGDPGTVGDAEDDLADNIYLPYRRAIEDHEKLTLMMQEQNLKDRRALDGGSRTGWMV